MKEIRAIVAAAWLAGPALSDERTIALVEATGTRIEVGSLDLAPDGAYRIRWNDALFGDFFLSMRPFKCLEGADRLWCRVDYPYENRRRIAPGDVTDLEYDLLWVWKPSGAYGIDLWNGVYYRLSPAGDGWTGVMREIDLNVLAAPPPDGDLRPIGADMLEEGDPDSHWLPRIVID